jgi:hypothetical protein
VRGLLQPRGILDPVSARERDTVFVLIHSPLVGPTTWSPVARELERREREAVVPSLLGVADAASPQRRHVPQAIRAATARILKPIVLVGHSGGGLLLPTIADSLTVELAALVFVDSFLPPAGGSVPLAPPGFIDKLRALASDGVLPRWSSWFGEDAWRELVPDQRLRAALRRRCRACRLPSSSTASRCRTAGTHARAPTSSSPPSRTGTAPRMRVTGAGRWPRSRLSSTWRWRASRSPSPTRSLTSNEHWPDGPHTPTYGASIAFAVLAGLRSTHSRLRVEPGHSPPDRCYAARQQRPRARPTTPSGQSAILRLRHRSERLAKPGSRFGAGASVSVGRPRRPPRDEERSSGPGPSSCAFRRAFTFLAMAAARRGRPVAAPSLRDRSSSTYCPPSVVALSFWSEVCQRFLMSREAIGAASLPSPLKVTSSSTRTAVPIGDGVRV